jgi:hypothetical protein
VGFGSLRCAYLDVPAAHIIACYIPAEGSGQNSSNTALAARVGCSCGWSAVTYITTHIWHVCLLVPCCCCCCCTSGLAAAAWRRN